MKTPHSMPLLSQRNCLYVDVPSSMAGDNGAWGMFGPQALVLPGLAQ